MSGNSLWFGVVTLFPEMIEQAASYGVFGRAKGAGGICVETFNPRTYTSDKHQTVDDKPYGGGPGMVMMVEPLLGAIEAARQAAPQPPRVVLMSAQGRRFDQACAEQMADAGGATILVCGRYEGVDDRLLQLAIDEELSVGDYVVSGGEVPALVIMDAVGRLAEGTVGNPASLESESHLDGSLEYPQYTRPENVLGHGVPPALLSGDHKRVHEHRRTDALMRTFERRPELLLQGHVLENAEDRRLLGAALQARGKRQNRGPGE